MSAPAAIEVRALALADVAAVAALAAIVPTAPHWPIFEFARLARVSAAEPQVRGAWVAVDPGGAVAGFAMARQAAGEVELESIVTDPSRRRQGVGAALLAEAVGWARRAGAHMLQLECRASNAAALRLYERCGFAANGRRPAYYSNPCEDAVLMQRTLAAD